MGSLVSIAGAVQWISGLVLAVVVGRRASRFGRPGRAPSFIAGIAIGLFLLAALDLLASALSHARWSASWFPPDFGSDQWQLRILLLLSVGAWALLGAAALWNYALAIQLRRREAAAELRRRTERARETTGRRQAEPRRAPAPVERPAPGLTVVDERGLDRESPPAQPGERQLPDDLVGPGKPHRGAP